MGATRCFQTIEALWASIIPKNASFDYQSDDEEVLKLSLLLKSTQVLVTGLRQKELTASSQLEGVTNQLTSMAEKLRLCESENKVLQKDVTQLKVKLESAEDKAKKFQNEAEASTAKCERLKSKISSEVETLLLRTFKNCLRQNKAATIQDMMTQMYPETQLPESEADHSAAEPIAPKQSVKQPLMPRNVDVGSPEVIQATPPHCKESKESSFNVKKEKHRGSGLLAHKVASAAEDSAPSSPDIIAGTPTPKNNIFKKKDKIEKKNNKKRMEMLRLLISDDQETVNELECERKSIVYAKDTQDMDEVQDRPVLRENIIVPETYNPGSSDLDGEENNGNFFPRKGNQNEPSAVFKDVSSRNGKENKKNSSGLTDVPSQKDKANERHSSEFKDVTPLKKENERHLPQLKDLSPKERKEKGELSPAFKNSPARKVSNSSSDALPFSTPKRPSKPREKSPILGNSGSKKNCSKSFNTSANKSKKSPRSDKKNHWKGGSLHEDNVSIEYRKTLSGKYKVVRQPSIQKSFANNSKLSLSKNKKDISKDPGFNGGQRSAKALSLNITQMSEAEQIQFALEKSVQETTNNSIMEDSDATLFIPPDNQGVLPKEKSINVQSPGEPIRPSAPEAESDATFFQPNFASTEREVYPTTKHSIHNQSGDLGPPLFSSTEKGQMENSALDMLAQHLEEEKEYNSYDCGPLDTTYDRLFKKSSSPNYAYKGPTVRKKAERMALPGMDCTQCGKYFAMAFGDDSPDAKRQAIDSCSRHRGNHERVRSPPGYWDVVLPPTQFMRERQEQPTD